MQIIIKITETKSWKLWNTNPRVCSCICAINICANNFQLPVLRNFLQVARKLLLSNHGPLGCYCKVGQLYIQGQVKASYVCTDSFLLSTRPKYKNAENH